MAAPSFLFAQRGPRAERPNSDGKDKEQHSKHQHSSILDQDDASGLAYGRFEDFIAGTMQRPTVLVLATEMAESLSQKLGYPDTAALLQRQAWLAEGEVSYSGVGQMRPGVVRLKSLAGHDAATAAQQTAVDINSAGDYGAEARFFDMRGGFGVDFVSRSALEARLRTSGVHVPPADRGEREIIALKERYASLAGTVCAKAPEERLGAAADVVLRGAEDVPGLQMTVQNAEPAGDPTPWFSHWRWEYLKSLGLTEVDGTSHPVLILLVATSTGDACSEFVDLFDASDPHPFLRALGGVIDTVIARHYLLLHDNGLGSEGDALRDKAFTAMRSTFERANCHVVSVNTRTPGVEDVGVYGFVRELVERGIFPQIERKISELRTVCESSRRGVRNAIKGWLGFGRKSTKKEKDLPTDLPSTDGGVGVKYDLSHMTRNYKRLGDLCFLLRNYADAEQQYKQVVKDSFSDRTFSYYAAASEMCGLCGFLLDPSRRDIDTHMQNAFRFWAQEARDNIVTTQAARSSVQSHARGSANGQKSASASLELLCRGTPNQSRYCVRACLLYASILVSKGLHHDAGQLLVKATQSEIDKDRLTAALLYEQAALCCILPRFGAHYRRYCFRLVMAGHCFVLFGNAMREAQIKPVLPPFIFQKKVSDSDGGARNAATKHSMRSYSSAYAVFDRLGWELISDHIHHRLARHSYAQSMWDDAKRHSAALLRTADPFTLPLRGAEPPGWVDAFSVGDTPRRSPSNPSDFWEEHSRESARYLLEAPAVVAHHEKNQKAHKRTKKGHWQAADKQAQYLKEFLHVFEAAARHVHSARRDVSTSFDERPAMPVPIVQSGTIEVDLRDSPHTHTRQAGRSNVRDWKKMEEDFIVRFDKTGRGDPAQQQEREDELRRATYAPTWLDKANSEGASDRAETTGDQSQAHLPPHLSNLRGVVGEPIEFSLEIENPLDLVLHLDEAQLLCEFIELSESSQFVDDPFDGTVSDPLRSDSSGSVDGAQAVKKRYDTPSCVFTLKPREKRRVTLTIIPRFSGGTLNVYGMGFILHGPPGSSNVVGRVDLFSTQQGGERHSHNDGIHVWISGPQPVLQVSLQKLPTFLLSGQSDGGSQLVLKNCGSTPLDTVRVRVEDSALSMFEFKPVSLANPSLPKYDVVAELHSGRLDPGQSVQLPLCVRPNVVGAHEFGMLFQFLNTEDKDSASSKLPYRLERLVGSLVCVPSIQVTATTSVSFSSANAYVLQVDVTNMHSVGSGRANQTFLLDSLRSVATDASSRWNLIPLSGIDVSHNQCLAVGPAQARSMFFRVIPENDLPTASKDTMRTHLLSASASSEAAPEDPTVRYFLDSEKAAIARVERARAHKAATSGLRTTVRPNIRTLDLVLCWRAQAPNSSGEVIDLRGQHHVIGVPVTDMSTGGASSSGSHFRFSIESPHSITHNFVTPSSLPAGDLAAHVHAHEFHDRSSDATHAHTHAPSTICSVPMVFSVTNTSGHETVVFSFETLRPNEELPSTPSVPGPDTGNDDGLKLSNSLQTSTDRPQSNSSTSNAVVVSSSKRAQYFWAANTRHAGLSLGPGESTALHTLVCFTRPGIYNINRYLFSVSHGGRASQTVLPTFQHVIRIEDANEVASAS